MANTLPISLSMGSLPSTVQWTPQQLADAIAARLSLVTSQTFALFVTGSTAPTSNVGPWLKNGKEWWVWSNSDGAYVPIDIVQASLGYIISSSAPDSSVYQFWIETAPGGSPLAIKIYFSGAWVDVYATKFADYSTTTQMNTAIAAAVAGIPAAPSTYPGVGSNSVAQSIPTTSVSTKILITVATINPAPGPINTGTSRYEVPATGNYLVSATTQFDNNTATASGVEVQLGLFKNGSDTGIGDQDGTPSPNGGRWSPGFTVMVPLVAGDYLELFVSIGDGVGTGAVNLTDFQFSVFRVSA